jgi:uncharacterized membrane protein YfcA
MHFSVGRETLLAFAALGAGIVNGAAGGGTLLSFPALLAVGYPALTANVTSSVGIWTGYLGGVAGYRREIGAQSYRLQRLGITALVGGILGGILLLTTPSDFFKVLAPYLLLFSSGLFAVQPILSKQLAKRREAGHSHAWILQSGVFMASMYGAYFGAGLGVVYLAILAITLPDPLAEINGLRSVLSLLVNTAAVIVFLISSSHIAWTAAAIMAGCALAGGYIGARIARRIHATALRIIVIVLGVATSIDLLVH